MKWLEDELELNALHNPGSRQGSGNEKAAVSQRTALSAALGGRVDVGAMSTISGLVNFLHLIVDVPILSPCSIISCVITSCYLVCIIVLLFIIEEGMGELFFVVGSFH